MKVLVTGAASGNVVVAVGGDEALLRAHFRTVALVTVFGHSLASPAERHVRIYLCRDPVAPLDADLAGTPSQLPADHPPWQRDVLSISSRTRALIATIVPTRR